MPRAFVSYSRDDKKFVDAHIKTILDGMAVDMWIDTDALHGAEQWKQTIQNAIPNVASRDEPPHRSRAQVLCTRTST